MAFSSFLFSWLRGRNLLQNHKQRPYRRKSCWLNLETLEDRTLPDAGFLGRTGLGDRLLPSNNPQPDNDTVPAVSSSELTDTPSPSATGETNSESSVPARFHNRRTPSQQESSSTESQTDNSTSGTDSSTSPSDTDQDDTSSEVGTLDRLRSNRRFGRRLPDENPNNDQADDQGSEDQNPTDDNTDPDNGSGNDGNSGDTSNDDTTDNDDSSHQGDFTDDQSNDDRFSDDRFFDDDNIGDDGDNNDDDNDDDDGEDPEIPEVGFGAPGITDSHFPVTVTVDLDKFVAGFYDPVGYLQIDLNHNGSFTDTVAESQFHQFLLEDATASFIISGLIYGTYDMRIRVRDVITGFVYSDVFQVEITNPDLPLGNIHFEPNQGQTGEEVAFLGRTADFNIFLTSEEMVFVTLRYEEDGEEAVNEEVVQRVQFEGANPNVQIVGTGLLPGKSNYFLGHDPSGWVSHVPNYSGVTYQDLYDNIDLRVFTDNGRFRYDFVVKPGGDVNDIQLKQVGATGLQVNEFGELVFALEPSNSGDVLLEPEQFVHSAPMTYQVGPGGQKEAIRSGFDTSGGVSFGFHFDSHDPTREVIIDPFVYTTFIGGNMSDRTVRRNFVDDFGNQYVTGDTLSTNFPTQDPLIGPGNGSVNSGMMDVFVTKLSADGSTLLFSTYLGGSEDDQGFDIAVDSQLNIVVGGWTQSFGVNLFPTTPGTLPPGGRIPQKPAADGFVTKFSADGSQLIFSTFLGGSERDEVNGVAVDGFDNIAVTGFTESTITSGAGNLIVFPANLNTGFILPSRGNRDAFVTTFGPNGENFTNSVNYFSHVIGGAGNGAAGNDEGVGVAMDLLGRIYMTGYSNSATYPLVNPIQFNQPGQDVVLTRLNPDGTLTFSSYIGGGFIGGGTTDFPFDIVVDQNNNDINAGQTISKEYPTPPGTFHSGTRAPGRIDFDGFITKVNLDGGGILLSSYFGAFGSNELITDLAVDFNGNFYVVGSFTGNPAFPTNVNPIQPPGSSPDTFLSVFDDTLSSLLLSTELGGTGFDAADEVAVDPNNNIYVAGQTTNPASFAMQNTTGASFFIGSLMMQDIFLVRIDPVEDPVFVDDAFELNDQSDNSANFGPLNPGLLVFPNLNTVQHEDSSFDDDWFSFTAAANGTLTVIINRISTFARGPNGDPDDSGDLHVKLFRLVDGSFLDEIDSSEDVDVTSQRVDVNVTAGETYFIWVYGFFFTQARYDFFLLLN